MKYYWRYIKGYVPYKKSAAMTLGSILHQAFDMFYNNFSEEEVGLYIKKTCDEEIAKAPPEQEEELGIMKYTLLGMWINYPKDLSAFSEIKPELEFRLKFKNGVNAILRIDGLLVQEGHIWIRELKSTGLSFPQFEKRCKTSPQCSFYTYCVKRLGYDVQGVIYDFVKKPLLRRGVNETVKGFGERIIEDYRKRPEYYYKRHYSYRSDEDLLIFEEDIMATARDIQRRCKNNDWYRNPDNCWSFNSACPYMPICFKKEPDNLTIEVFFTKQEINLQKGDDKYDQEGQRTSNSIGTSRRTA